MTERLPVNVVQGAGLLWMLSAPVILLGSALSKMDTPVRYNVQLAVCAGVCALAVAAGFGAFARATYRWARLVLIALSWAAAAFWLASGYSLFPMGYVLPGIIGCCYAAMAFVLHHAERRPSRETWNAA
jgi:hypothetical protein